MDENRASDAQLLWEDACSFLSQGAQERLVKMAQACKPLDFSGGVILVEAPSGFAARVIERERATIEAALAEAAFEPVSLDVAGSRAAAPQAPHAAEAAPRQGEGLSPAPEKSPAEPASSGFSAPSFAAAPSAPSAPAAQSRPRVDGSATSISLEQFKAYKRNAAPAPPVQKAVVAGHAVPNPEDKNPLVEKITANDSTLTFDTFVEADENRFALQAAKQVANGISDQYNPLFIHGSSGLGKTHLLRAIQNYVAKEDPDRQCVYRVARDFINDFTNALGAKGHSSMEALERNYHDVDILILDDVQHLTKASKTVDFFFDTFNYLVSHGKQIVLAADEPPGQLGMPERITSRMSQGLSVAVQSPTLEFKRVLIGTFYDRMKAEGGPFSDGTLTPEDLTLMAERAGGNIRSIRSFVQDCLFRATHLESTGGHLEPADIVAAAAERWSNEGKRVTVDDIQRLVQTQYGITRQDLVGSKRSKEIAQPRHIAIWLCRELTDQTLADIGKHFGGRSHATVKHSIAWVEETMENDRVLLDRLLVMRERLRS